MNDYERQAADLLAPLSAAEIGLITDDRSMQMVVLGSQVRAQGLATLALVAATLAQTEQLRIANLIAYKQLHTPRAVDARGTFFDLVISRDDMTDAIEAGLL